MQAFLDMKPNPVKLKLLGIYKPQISAIICELPTIVSISESIILNGAKSLIPYEANERVSFKWQCISCYSFVSNSNCDCPFISESEAVQECSLLCRTS